MGLCVVWSRGVLSACAVCTGTNISLHLRDLCLIQSNLFRNKKEAEMLEERVQKEMRNCPISWGGRGNLKAHYHPKAGY